MIRQVRYGKKVASWVLSIEPKAIIGVSGLVTLSCGCFMAWQPGGPIVFGLGMIAEAIAIEREESRGEHHPQPFER